MWESIQKAEGFLRRPKPELARNTKLSITMCKTETSICLQQWHSGDGEALNTLIERHLPWIRAQVRRRMTSLLQKKGETLDYVQDAMLQFLRFGPRFTIANENYFRALLLRIVENSLLNKYDWFTARRRDLARERPLPSDTVLSLDPPRETVKTPSKSAQRHEQEAWIRLGMELICPEYREVLVLREWDKLSFKEIGERLGITPNAARLKHYRAVRQLGKKIVALRDGELSRILEESPVEKGEQ